MNHMRFSNMRSKVFYSSLPSIYRVIRMRTTLHLEGYPLLILQKAVELGIARSKTDALRLGVFSLNKEFGLVKDIEEELVSRKLQQEENDMKKGRKKYLSEDEALSKYR